MTTTDLTSYTGIAAVSGFIAEVLKRKVRNVKIISYMPMWALVTLLAGILTIIANKVLKMPDGRPYLADAGFWTMIWKSVTTAAISSGFYSWITNPEPVSTVSDFEPMKK